MADKATVLVVDDDFFMREILGEMLEGNYHVASTDNGAGALELVSAQRPDMILLDVELPDIDGYEVCRRLKGNEVTAAIPVIFVSAHDQIEDRLKGYEAGGEDYIVKPCEPKELEAKIEHLLRAIAERSQIKEMADYASRTAMTAMSSMSEMGALIETLKGFNTCMDHKALADAMVTGLALYDLQGAAQIRTPEETLTRTNRGDANPLERSVIGHMAGMDRIVQFKSKMSITYDHVTLLVNDLPLEDADRCGRLRDHLAMLTEGAEVRTQSIIAETEARRRGEVIEQAVERIAETLQIDAAQRQTRIDTNLAVREMTDRINKAYISMGITDSQEAYMTELVHEGIERILNAQSAEVDLQDKMTSIFKELKTVLGLN